MNALFSLLTLLSLLTSSMIFSCMFRLRTRVERLAAVAVLFSAQIVLIGYLLSMLTRIDSLAAWMVAGLAMLIESILPLIFLPELRNCCLCIPKMPREIEARLRELKFNHFSGILLLIIGIILIITTLVNLLVIITLPPSTPDVQDYHLARVAYYLQQGNLRYFDAQYWAQVVYPKVATILQLFSYLVAERIDMLTQMVQFLAYLVTLVAGYGTCRLLGASRRAAFFAVAVLGLLPIVLTEAATAQNDLILTAFIACSLLFLLEYRASQELKNIVLASIAFALAVGVKATILPLLLPLAIIVFFLFRQPFLSKNAFPPKKHLAFALISLIAMLVLFTLPAGYWDNFQRFGDPFGPMKIRAAYTNETNSPLQMAQNGGLNVLRYGVDFLVIDGAVPWPGAANIQQGISSLQKSFFQALGINLESKQSTREHFPFSYKKSIIANATTSSWGQVGFMIIWPMLIIALFHWRRAPVSALFATSFMVYALTLAFILPYDNFHGRFFATGALFALPVLADGFTRWQQSAFGRGYLSIACLLMCMLALSSVFFRSGTPLFSINYNGKKVLSVFLVEPIYLPLREDPSNMLVTYEELVPKDAIVALDTKYNMPDYLFFGQGLTRKVVPLRDFFGHHKPLPSQATWLIYDRFSPHFQEGGYILLPAGNPRGEIFLRKLP